jgi:hypothetical protein
MSENGEVPFSHNGVVVELTRLPPYESGVNGNPMAFVSVVPSKARPAPMASELSPPVVLPTRMPPSGVVEPVPPYS